MVAKLIASTQFCIDISTANLFAAYFCTSEVHLNTISLNDKFFFVFPTIERVTKMTVLGVIIYDRLTSTDHVTELLLSCTKLIYAMRVLRTYGLPHQSLQDVFRATVEAKLLYAAPALSGFSTAADRSRINSFLRRCLKLGYRDSDSPDVDCMFADSDEQFFDRIKHTIIDTYCSNIYQTVLIWTTFFAADITTRHL